MADRVSSGEPTKKAKEAEESPSVAHGNGQGNGKKNGTNGHPKTASVPPPPPAPESSKRLLSDSEPPPRKLIPKAAPSVPPPARHSRPVPLALVAEMLTLNTPLAVGVPEMRPLVEFNANPAGKPVAL